MTSAAWLSRPVARVAPTSPAPARAGARPPFVRSLPMNKLHDPELELFKRTVDLAN